MATGRPKTPETIRVVSWNVANRGTSVARRLGGFLADLHPPPNLVMLQEVNRNALEALCGSAGLSWWRAAVDLRTAQADDTRVRRCGVAVCGRGPDPIGCAIVDGVPLPERTLIATVPCGEVAVSVASYHAPPGVNWGILKPRQAVAFALLLQESDRPFILGADANTPLLDAPSFSNSRTHWHTGDRKLHGEDGDDLMFGPTKIHGLDDALRRWLEDRPGELAVLAAKHPNGPLAVSHRTGKNRGRTGTPRRFDAVWVSSHFAVRNVAYAYEASCEAGSDHAAVVVDLACVKVPK